MKMFCANFLFEKFDTCKANLVDHVELRRSYKTVSDHFSTEMKPCFNESNS